MVQIVIPVGPRDNLEWVKRSVQSALGQGVEVIVYDNSERRDIHEYFLALQGKLRYVQGQQDGSRQHGEVEEQNALTGRGQVRGDA
jgi:hypothetical protein